MNKKDNHLSFRRLPLTALLMPMESAYQKCEIIIIKYFKLTDIHITSITFSYVIIDKGEIINLSEGGTVATMKEADTAKITSDDYGTITIPNISANKYVIEDRDRRLIARKATKQDIDVSISVVSQDLNYATITFRIHPDN